MRRAATKLRLRLTGRWNLELRKGRRNLADFARSGSKMVHVKSASLSSTKPLLSLPGLCKIENLMTPSSQPSVQIRPARAFSWADLLEL